MLVSVKSNGMELTVLPEYIYTCGSSPGQVFVFSVFTSTIEMSGNQTVLTLYLCEVLTRNSHVSAERILLVGFRREPSSKFHSSRAIFDFDKSKESGF